MNQDKNTRVLRDCFPGDPAGHATTATRCLLANGLEIAIVVVSEVEQFTAIDSPNAFSLQSLYKDQALAQPGNQGLLDERAKPDECDLLFDDTCAVEDENSFGEGEIH